MPVRLEDGKNISCHSCLPSFLLSGNTLDQLPAVINNQTYLHDIKDIIAGCIANNRVSQEKLYRRFYPALFCLCRKFFSDDHKAMETVNDGMIKVFKNLPAYREGKGEFFNWVYTIVRHTALDKLKGTVQTIVSLESGADEPDLDTSPVQQLEWKDMYACLDQLPPATRTVFTLFYLEGYRIHEISDQLGISAGTVKWHLSESRKLVQPLLKKYFMC